MTRNAGMLGLVLTLACALVPTAAHALDVDRIEIRSRLGEPLLAEIPITDASAEDLKQLQAQLASSTTFARVGLPRPQGVVADLNFEVVKEGGRPVIRITSQVPVQEDFLTFLVQVEWAQGRLVREYSVALGASPSLPDPVAPQIQAPVQAPSNAVVRAPDPADALPAPPEAQIVAPAAASADAIPLAGAEPPPIPLSAGTRPPVRAPAAPAAAPAAMPATPATRPSASRQPAVAPTRPASGPAAPTPARQANAARPTTAKAATPQPQPKPAPAAVSAQGGYAVREGDTLTGIASRMEFSGVTEAQAMLALLRSNPDAFGKGNINMLRRGAILRTPAQAELTRLDPAAAEAMVRLQIQQWRSGNMPEPPAAAVAALPAATAPAPASAAQSAPAAARVAPARLEIAPAAAASAQTAGGGNGGSGDAAADRARAEADALAVRYSEFQEMRVRVAELEQLQKQQQKLLQLKDDQLSAQPRQGAGWWPWLVAALALGVAAFALLRRRPAVERPGKQATALSASFASNAAPVSPPAEDTVDPDHDGPRLRT